MARTSTYLNFPRSTEEAFRFYKSVFGTEFVGPIVRHRDVPSAACEPGSPGPAESDKDLIIHIELPILGGHALMGTDTPDSMGFTLTRGNNVFINLEPDTRAETDRLFQGLSAGGVVEMPLAEMFWGGYFGTIVDRFGTRWMFNCRSKT